MRILVLCPYPERRAPSQRLKYEQYFESWRNAGYAVEIRPFWDLPAWRILYRKGAWVRKATGLVRGFVRRLGDLRRAARADLVYLHLEALPVGPPVLERRIRARGIPLVYDIDDLVYLPHSSRANRFMHCLRWPGKVPEIIRLADHTVVCTEYLREYAHRFSDKVTNISSTINTDVYLPRAHRDILENVVIGWSGSHSTAPYLHALDSVFQELQDSHGVRIRVIGDAGFRIPGVQVEAQEWQEQREVAALSEFDIGVYPLPHEEWVRGKSGLKALQYMALEIPTVAEAVGTNFEIIRDGENGFLVRNPDEWLSVLRRLVLDPALRRRIGRKGRETVLDRYSVRANVPRYLNVLSDALGR